MKLLLAVSLALAGRAAALDSARGTAARRAAVGQAAQETPADERLILHTAHGDIVAALYPGAAPRHVAQVLRLARLGAYDTVPVARILPGYLVQFAGARARRLDLDPLQHAALRRLPLEPSGLRHSRGVLTMSREPDRKDSAESAFSILLKDSPHLDGSYTAFGRVERGWETLDALAQAPVLPDKRPRHWLEITAARVVPAAQVEAYVEPAGKRGGKAPRAALLGLLFASFALSGAASLLDAQSKSRLLRAACLLNALLAFFCLLVLVAPSLPLKGAVPAALFGSALVLFRLLAAFEPPRDTT